MPSNSSSNETEPLALETLVVVQVTCYVAIAVTGATGNLMLCTALLRKRRRKTCEYFVLNLAFTDLMTCAVSIPLDIVDITSKHWPFGAFMCKVVYPLQTVLIAVSVGTLTCMALERYRAIITPLKAKIKGKIIKLAVFLVWSASMALLSPYIAVLESNGSSCIESWPEENHPKVFTMCVFLLLYAVPLCIISPAYICIGFRLRSNSRRMQKLISPRHGRNLYFQRLSQRRSRTNVRIVKMFLLAAVAFALCLLPYQIMWLWYDFGNGKEWNHFWDALVFANAMVYSNSLINPFIFGGFSKRHWCRENVWTDSMLKRFNIGVKKRRSKLTRNNAILAFHVDKNCNLLKQPAPSTNSILTYISSV